MLVLCLGGIPVSTLMEQADDNEDVDDDQNGDDASKQANEYGVRHPHKRHKGRKTDGAKNDGRMKERTH